MITGWQVRWHMFRLWFRIGWVVYREAKGALKAVQVIKALYRQKKAHISPGAIPKLAKVDGRVFFNMNAPGFPSPAFDQFFRHTTRKLLNPEAVHPESARFVMLSVTKKCPMRCEHCFEWDELNREETLTPDHLQRIVRKYQLMGTSQFLLSGGEPMVRFNDMISLLKSADKISDFWMTTSAFNLTLDKAKQLKAAGLTGVAISLDHYDEQEHNNFRGHHRAFRYAIEGAQNAQDAGLVVGFSVCTVRSFCTPGHLLRYAELARDLGVPFIHLLEPRALGRYAGKDVELGPEQYEVLDTFYEEANSGGTYRDLPWIIHTSYNQRKYGCLSAGLDNIMIDTDGHINACPFCRSKGKYALDEKSGVGLNEIRQRGCHKFKMRSSPTL